MFKQQLKALAVIMVILGVLGFFFKLTGNSMAQFAPADQYQAQNQ